MNGNDELWADMTLQRSARVGHRNIWFYHISTAIGNFYVVEWEADTLEIHDKIFREGYENAEKYFERTVAKIALGKM